MITDFKNKTAVPTGAGSGFGLECARIGARLGMNLVLADVQQDALMQRWQKRRRPAQTYWACGSMCPRPTRCRRWPMRLLRVLARHLVFNNAGVGAGGLVWENSVQDWEGCWA